MFVPVQRRSCARRSSFLAVRFVISPPPLRRSPGGRYALPRRLGAGILAGTFLALAYGLQTAGLS
jgi:hypothetical protein